MLAGATSGVLGTATSIGGPPMALVWQNSSGPKLRGTMSGFFLVGSVLSIAVLAITGGVGRTGAMNAQCASHLAPCSIHLRISSFSSGLSFLCDLGGGITSSSSSVTIRW